MHPAPPPGSASTLVVLLLLLFLCFVPPCVRSSPPGCPAPCACKWKSGKQTAECANQNLTAIPEDINPDTQVLDLSGNYLGELPSLVFQKRGLVNLQKTFLAGCSIRWVAPDAFYQLSNLVELDLTKNQLTDIPTSVFSDTSMLRRLLMEGNSIRRLYADSFGNLTYLTMLDLSQCRISSIQPGAFRGLRNLEILKLDGNELTVLRSEVLQNLPPLYAFSLQNNPWHCDCYLRDLRQWISGNNIPTSIRPKCKTPERLEGEPWTQLAMEELACLPVTESAVQTINALRGDNATIECSVTAVPEATLEWVKDGLPVANLTADPEEISAKYRIETRDHMTFLHVSDVDIEDAGTYGCVAENPAGTAEVNFTLVVIYATPAATGWSRAQIVGIVLGCFIGLVALVVIACIVVLRCRTLESNTGKFNGVGILKQLASKQKETTEVSVEKSNELTTDKTPRQETGSSGYGSDQHTPDLTNKGSAADHHANGPTYSTKAFLYSHPVHDSLTRETFNLQEQCFPPVSHPLANGSAMGVVSARRLSPQGENYHGYSNEFPSAGYHQPYETPPTPQQRYSPTLQQQYSPHPQGGDAHANNGFLCDTDRSRNSDNYSECASVKDESYNSYSSPAHPANVAGVGAPTVGQVTWKRTPIVVPNSAQFELPTDRRYSPDEGYAEEALEGTEV